MLYEIERFVICIQSKDLCIQRKVKCMQSKDMRDESRSKVVCNGKICDLYRELFAMEICDFYKEKS